MVEDRGRVGDTDEMEESRQCPLKGRSDGTGLRRAGRLRTSKTTAPIARWANTQRCGGRGSRTWVDDWRGGGRRMGVALPGGLRDAGASLPAQSPLIQSPPRSVYPTWGGCTRSGLFCYSVTSTDTDPEQLFVVSDSPVTASTHAPCTAPGFLDTRLRYAAWRSSYSSRASSGVRYASFSRRQHWL